MTDTNNLTEATEEYLDNEATDVEKEREEGNGADLKPWDPSKIRIQTKTFSLRQITDMIKDEEVDLAPDFQRSFVWKERQRSRLIESILLGIPLPAFYFNAEADGRMQVVDGVQRLTTISTYVHRDFLPMDMEYLGEEHKQGYAKLDAVWRRRFNNTQIFVHVIDPQTPDAVKFDVFRRINTGGSPLTAQEIRHCMSKSRSREFLKRLAASPAFRTATGNSLISDRRMMDRELVIRFIAFRILPRIEDFPRDMSLDDFLMAATRRIDSSLTEDEINQLETDFTRAMRNAHRLFGAHAFRKWTTNSDRRSPLNRALFESWAVALADVPESDLISRQSAIVAKARGMMTNDYDYLYSISVGTGDYNKVVRRFSAARLAVAP